jgi:hypothetical protein
MATTFWTGAVSTDWDTVGNWNSTIPVDGDDVIVQKTAGKSLLTNIDRTGDSAGAGLHLNNFLVEDGFKYSVGANGARLKLTSNKITVQHAGQFWFL